MARFAPSTINSPTPNIDESNGRGVDTPLLIRHYMTMNNVTTTTENTMNDTTTTVTGMTSILARAQEIV